MEPGIWVRAIEYEALSRDMAQCVGLSAADVKGLFGQDSNDLAVVKCVDRSGQKVTAIGDLAYFRELLVSGEARDVGGMILRKTEWPVLLQGWLKAS